MKTIMKILTISLISIFLVSGSFAMMGNGGVMKSKGYGQNQEGIVYEVYDDTQVDHQSEIDIYSYQEVDEQEIEGLLLMREEFLKMKNYDLCMIL